MPTVAIVSAGQTNIYNAADFSPTVSAFRGGGAGDYHLTAEVNHLIPVKLELKPDKELSGKLSLYCLNNLNTYVRCWV